MEPNTNPEPQLPKDSAKIKKILQRLQTIQPQGFTLLYGKRIQEYTLYRLAPMDYVMIERMPATEDFPFTMATLFNLVKQYGAG